MRFILSILILLNSYSLLLSQNTDKSYWITPSDDSLKNKANVWLAFRKEINIKEIPTSFKVKIACDTKYWLWINGKLAISEGSLKRGPTPADSYVDEVNLAKFLLKGKNTFAILVWHFGRSGFAHKSTGIPALYVESGLLKSDKNWKAMVHPAFSSTGPPHPNFRLAEQNTRFDAQKDIPDWINPDFKDSLWKNALEIGTPPDAPWGKLIIRPIPMFKDFGKKSYTNQSELLGITKQDTLKAKLPYNAQVTPWFKIETSGGKKVDLLMDNYFVGGNKNYASVRTEYITKPGVQEFEAFAWMNGHEVYYVFPKGTKVIDIGYRESGYATNFTGSFTCDDAFNNKLREKALRTLYVTLRDNYMDCPDRERAQWWGDAVIEIGETFYAFDTMSYLLSKKAILELVNWQRKDSVMYSPVPDGNWGKELPPQILASISMYGFWNYYWYTGDLETIKKTYPAVKRYLAIWKKDEYGMVYHRKGDWDWEDWGENIDAPILDNCWYYLALEAAEKTAELIGEKQDALSFKSEREKIKRNFNNVFWKGDHYRSNGYTGEPDDRANGMAVLIGMADSAKWISIKKLLGKEFHASPYMEKYILECFFKMNDADGALERMKKRYKPMVESKYTTLWENFSLTEEDTYNHAWSGGPLTLLSQYIAGIEPLIAGYGAYKIVPQMGSLKTVECKTSTCKGDITVALSKTENKFEALIDAPSIGGILGIPKCNTPYSVIEMDGIAVWRKEEKKSQEGGIREEKLFYFLYIDKGKHTVKAY